MRKILLPTVIASLAAFASLASTAASAAALTCGDFTLGDATACVAGVGNNDPYPGDLSAFGVTWSAIDKDNNAGVIAGTDPDTNNPESWFQWTAAAGQPENDARAGNWLLDSALWGVYDRLLVAVKAANTYSVFELESGDASGTWASVQGLSHLSLYGIEGDDQQQVPEPGSLALLGLGLLSIGAARRRRS